MRRPELAEQFSSIESQAHAARFGMWVFLGSETLLFAALFGLYGAYRTMYPADFAHAVAYNNAIIGTTNTAVLITSSLTVALSIHSLRQSRSKVAGWLLALTVMLGGVFLLLKGIEYREHFHEHIFPGAAYASEKLPSHGANLFFTIYFLATGLHALHVIAGMGVLGGLAVFCMRNAYGAEYHLPVELAGLYWHLVDLVWIFLWPILYLAR